MSLSAVSEGVIQRAKLLVHIAENGQSFELDCDEFTIVESVQMCLESLSGIPLNDQLLLYLDMKLEPQQQLSTYKLPSDDREIFVFNKAKMRSNSTPPQPEEFEVAESNHPDPPLPSSSHDPHPLDEALDPALKALPSYERQFRYHYQLGDAIYRRTLVRYETCERLWRAKRVQEKALEISRGNLDHYYKMIFHNYMDFMKCYSQQQKAHSNLLVNFGKDLERLRSIKLLPVLQTSNRKCLLDFVKEENLRKMVEDCSSSHRQFESKVGDFKHDFGELKRSTEQLFSSKASINSRDLDRTIKDHQQYINEQKSIMQALSKDVALVKKLVNDCLTSQLSESLRPHDAVSALGPMYEGHDKTYLPKMRACDHAISNLLDFCKEKKSEMNIFVHGYMQKVAYIQHAIKDVRYKFSVFSEALKRQNDQFEHLKVVRGIGPAYRACLAEIVRRKSSMKLYMGMAGQLAEKLASKRDTEVRRREEFLKVNISYIPRDILASMGLYDTPSTCDVNVAPFDTNLLDIDFSDLDRYAPEHLVGLSFKKGSSSMSHESPHLTEIEESSGDGTEKYNDTEDFIEVSELVEIAGTSKIEVENAKLKAKLASAIALLCSFSPEIEYLDDSKVENLLKNTAEKTAEALHLKDEYQKHLESMLKVKHMQCESYEKRIKELERRLSDQYSLELKLNKDECKIGDSKSEIFMDDASYGSSSLLVKSDKNVKNLDDNMTDSSGTHLDSSMVEPNRVDKEVMVGDVGMPLAASSTADNMSQPLKTLSSDEGVEEGKDSGDFVGELQNLVMEKTNKLSETEMKLRDAMEEVLKLRGELEISRDLLDESQMNCAHLENCLHEAREEAETHLCAADRRASEYTTLRASAVNIRTLFERLKTSVSSPAFADSLCALSQSLSTSANENGDDGSADFRECVRVLADKVGILGRHRAELIERYTKAEASHEQLTKELEEKNELVNTLYIKRQSEKQANKEKISFGRLELHEIAAFILNAGGDYEAINRDSSTHYYLSSESVALYADHLLHRPSFIVGQIVHIERQTVKPSGQAHHVDTLLTTTDTGSSRLPYGLPVGTEYFVVTVAMLPETAIRSPPPAPAS